MYCTCTVHDIIYTGTETCTVHVARTLLNMIKFNYCTCTIHINTQSEYMSASVWLPVLCVTTTAPEVEGSTTTMLEEVEDVGGCGRMCVMCFGLRPRLPPVGPPATGTGGRG